MRNTGTGMVMDGNGDKSSNATARIGRTVCVCVCVCVCVTVCGAGCLAGTSEKSPPHCTILQFLPCFTIFGWGWSCIHRFVAIATLLVNIYSNIVQYFYCAIVCVNLKEIAETKCND